MHIQRRPINVETEKNILIGLIVSDRFTKEIHPILRDTYHYFKSPHIKIAISWALDYYEKFKTVCGSTIQDIFNIKSEELNREADIELLEDTLLDVSERYEEGTEEFNADFHIENTIMYCKKVSLLNLSSEIKGLVETNDVLRAEHQVDTYNRVESITTDGVDVSSEETDKLRDELYSPNNNVSVVEFDGALGQLWGRIEKGSLHIIVSSAKRGKSLFCNDISRMCRMKGLKVAYFSFEMSAKKLLERHDMCVSRSLLYKNPAEMDEYVEKESTFKKQVNIPYFTEDGSLDYEAIQAEPLTAEKAKRANRLFKRQYRGGELKFYDVVSSGATVDGVIATLDLEASKTGRPFDICIIDSVYLMSGGKGSNEYERWGNLHWSVKQRICEAKGIPVLTPFQFNRGALSSVDPDEKDLASSYAIFMHVSSALYLRATPEEVKAGTMRIAASGRDGSYGNTSQVVITRALDIGRGVIDSRWMKSIPNYEVFVKGYKEMTEADEEELLSLDEV